MFQSGDEHIRSAARWLRLQLAAQKRGESGGILGNGGYELTKEWHADNSRFRLSRFEVQYVAC